MVDERDIHERKKRIKTVLNRIEDSEEITEENTKLLKEFNTHLKTVRSVKLDRRHFYINRLSKMAKWADKPFSEMNKKEVKKIQGKIEERDYTEWTKHDYLTALKKFFQWLHRDELKNYSWKSQKYPDIVSNIDTSVGKDANRIPKNLPEKQEIEKMMEVTKNTRDRAILMTLYDGGFRVGEFLNIKIDHLKQRKRGTSVTVHGKTGSRQVLMPMAEPYINKWLEDHPNSEEDSYLWVNIGNYNYGEPMKYRALLKLLKTLRKRADLTCKDNPHAFRKASATFYAQHLNEVQMCDRYGWVYGSDMPRIYIKKSGKRTNKAVLKANGMEEEVEKDEGFKSKECNRCGTNNPHDAEKCRNCGMLLDKSKVTEEYVSKDNLEDKLIEMIEENPDKWGSTLLEAMEKKKQAEN